MRLLTSSADTVDGGAGTDSVALSNNATVVDADFTNLSNVETISYGTNTMTLTLGTESDDAGIATVTDGTGAATITGAAGRTNALTVALSTGNDTVNASASGAALTSQRLKRVSTVTTPSQVAQGLRIP